MAPDAQRRCPPCAICDGTNLTTRLCAACRADPVNAGWREVAERPTAEATACGGVQLRLSAQSPVRRVPTLLQRRVLELMALRTLPTWVRRRVRVDGRRVWVWRKESRPLSYGEIAFLLGCSRSYCRKIYVSVAE